MDYSKYLGLVEDKFSDVIDPSGSKKQRFYHSLRVFKSCRMMLNFEEVKSLDIDEEALLIAAIFHDIGMLESIEEDNVIDYDKTKDHPEQGVKFLKRNSSIFPESKFEKICSIVEGHHDENPELDETLVLQDADNLDEEGIVGGIWRGFTHQGFHEKTLEEGLESYNQLSQDKKKGSLHEYHFDKIEELAKERAKKGRNVIEELKREHNLRDLKESVN